MAKFTTNQFIDAIPGTGGIISQIAAIVKCDWHTAKKYIDEHPSVKAAYDSERNKITDKARHNIIRAIHGGDLMISKWWLQVMDADFKPGLDLTSGGEKIAVVSVGIDVDKL